jgi:O-antigen polymerase
MLILTAVALESCLGLVQYFFFTEGFWGGYKVGISRPHGVFLQPNVMASLWQPDWLLPFSSQLK